MLDEDRVCYNCGKRWGQHYGEFCPSASSVGTAAETFIHDGRYCTPQGKIVKNTIKDDPNFLFRRRKQNNGHYR